MKFQILCCIAVIMIGCDVKSTKSIVQVRNPLPFARTELIEIKLSEFGSDTASYSNIQLRDGDSTMASQLVDTDHDGKMDLLIAMVTVGADETKELVIMESTDQQRKPFVSKVYSRFVPERIDDFAWENDLVAFRTYGPEAQRLVEEGKQGGTLSSGIDCWLKRVSYPVIDKWYKKNLEGGSYHQDDGEGYDPYHVGKSRGCGGVGVWMNDSLYVSRNFVSWKVLATGPLRNIFELEYAPWHVNDIIINEKKRISIDVGSRLMFVEEFLESSQPLPHLTIGLTLHDARGTAFADSVTGVFGYWEMIDGSHLGTGIVANPRKLLHFDDHRSAEPDENHIFINISAEDRVSYFAGFAWDKAGGIASKEEWKKYLDDFARRVRTPLVVTIAE